MVPWYKEKKFFVSVSIVISITVVIISIVNNSAIVNSSSKPSRPSESTVTIALEEFYGCTSGNEWIDKSNWLKFTVSWCDWYGVTCIENSKLIEDIALHSNNMQGIIPASISNLSSLNRLVLSYNSLTGTIPTEIGLLSNLEYLLLNMNSLIGTIPTDVGLLSNLSSLWLQDNNQMSGMIPVEVCNLMNNGSLQEVYISDTDIKNNC